MCYTLKCGTTIHKNRKLKQAGNGRRTERATFKCHGGQAAGEADRGCEELGGLPKKLKKARTTGQESKVI